MRKGNFAITIFIYVSRCDLVQHFVYTYATFVDCLKDIGLLGKRRNETNVFASPNKFEQAANAREYKKKVIMRF